MGTLDPWAVLALCAIALFAGFVVLMARRVLDMANTLAIVQKIDNLIDTRIGEVVDRLRARDQRGASKPALSKPAGSESPAENAAKALVDIFGGSPMEYEQPDPRLDVVGL